MPVLSELSKLMGRLCHCMQTKNQKALLSEQQLFYSHFFVSRFLIFLGFATAVEAVFLWRVCVKCCVELGNRKFGALDVESYIIISFH